MRASSYLQAVWVVATSTEASKLLLGTTQAETKTDSNVDADADADASRRHEQLDQSANPRIVLVAASKCLITS